MNAYPSEEKIKEIEWAYAEMVKRGWGFTSTGQGFGDPSSILTAVGPIENGLVEVWGADPDCVEAVKKAILKSGSEKPSGKGASNEATGHYR